jgi:hypothetical protein
MLLSIDGSVWENPGPTTRKIQGLSSWTFQAGVNLRIGGRGLEDGDRYVFFDSWQGYGSSRPRDVTFPGDGVPVEAGQRVIADAWCYGVGTVYLWLFVK